MKQLTIISMSGGLDSATLCAEALNEGHDVFILNFNYGQKNVIEQKAFLNLIEHFIKSYISSGKIVGWRQIDTTTLLNEFTDIWSSMRDEEKIKEKASHKFYMPSRNLFFSVLAAVIGEIVALNKNYEKIAIGLGIHKHSEEAYGKKHRDYWDITPQFAEKLNSVLQLNDVVKMEIYAPFVNKTKVDVVRRALELKVPVEKTWTCYDPQIENNIAKPCLKCEACIERQLAGNKVGFKNINDYFIKL